MASFDFKRQLSRRKFLKWTGKGLLLSPMSSFVRKLQAQHNVTNDVFWVKDIPHHPFIGKLGRNTHAGIECLLNLMGMHGTRFYRSDQDSLLSGPLGLIGAQDVVLIKVNAQWKYRGCTNSDLVRGVIQRVLNHPDGFNGEVIIIENGQGRGSLFCDTPGPNKSPYPDDTVHANAEDESHSYIYLVNQVFNDPRVSAYLLDPIRTTFIDGANHITDGYRIHENVSYPCFTSPKGHRIELKEGIWNGDGYNNNLKLINMPVLKKHDVAGSQITAALKHFYGILSMSDGQSKYRHYTGLGETCGKMVAEVRAPVLNILDAIWVSYSSLKGYPEKTTFRANQILASQDPVALDYWAAKHIMYPIDMNWHHHPDYPGIDYWLTQARNTINQKAGLYNPEQGLYIDRSTKDEQEMNVHEHNALQFIKQKIDQSFQKKRNTRFLK